MCIASGYDLDADNVEERSIEETIVEELGYLFACATARNVDNLFIIAHNDNYTQARILHKLDDVGYWKNGFNNAKLSVDQHIGTSVHSN